MENIDKDIELISFKIRELLSSPFFGKIIISFQNSKFGNFKTENTKNKEDLLKEYKIANDKKR